MQDRTNGGTKELNRISTFPYMYKYCTTLSFRLNTICNAVFNDFLHHYLILMIGLWGGDVHCSPILPSWPQRGRGDGGGGGE